MVQATDPFRTTAATAELGESLERSRRNRPERQRPARQTVGMRRVSVVGNSGSGKSALARQVADRLGVPYIELDAIHHLPGWTPIDPGEFRALLDEITACDGWVIDGNYRTLVVDGPVWQRADTVAWLDLPRRVVMRQVIGRTVRRAITREELWNGNREPWANFVRWDPERNIIRWSWTQHRKYQERFGSAMSDVRYAHLDFVRLTSHAEADAWLAKAASP